MKNYILLISLLLGLGAFTSCTKTPKTDEDKLSYFMGYNLGKSLKQQLGGGQPDLACQGLKDSVAGKESKVEQKDGMKAYQNVMNQKKEKDKMVAEDNEKSGLEFLKQNKTKEGVKETKTGLQYKVLTLGTGKAPKDTSKVSVHYVGRLTDGKEFDSSYKRNQPAEFTLNAVIKGWQEGLKLMKEGAKYELYIPSALAYGPRRAGEIPPNSVLVFEVELLKVTK